MEVAFSQKRKDLRRLAHNHLLGSQSNVQVFIGLDIEYGKNRTREATLSVWRMRHEHIAGKSKWEVVQVVADEVRFTRNQHTHMFILPLLMY